MIHSVKPFTYMQVMLSFSSVNPHRLREFLIDPPGFGQIFYLLDHHQVTNLIDIRQLQFYLLLANVDQGLVSFMEHEIILKKEKNNIICVKVTNRSNAMYMYTTSE